LGKDKEQTATVTIADFELAPESIAGLVFSAKITLSTPPFAVKGSVGTWGFSKDGDEYVVIGGKGMQTSRGEFTYEKLTSTTARFTTIDDLGHETEGTLVFSKLGLATYTDLGSAGRFTDRHAHVTQACDVSNPCVYRREAGECQDHERTISVRLERDVFDVVQCRRVVQHLGRNRRR